MPLAEPTSAQHTGITATGSTDTGSTETGSTDTGSTETGSTDTGGTDCEAVAGRGCSWLMDGPVLQCGSSEVSGGGQADTGTVMGGGGGGADGCGCGSAGGPGGVGLALLGFALLRRLRWSALLLLLLALPARAGVDAQQLYIRDGGDFVALREANIGAPWTLSAAWSNSMGEELALYVSDQGNEELIGFLWTEERALAFNIGSWVRLGADWPVHRLARTEDGVLPPTHGDIGLWATVPLLAPQQVGDRAVAATLHVDVPTGNPDRWLGDPDGYGELILSGEGPAGPVVLAGNFGVHLQPVVEVPGGSWGHRLLGAGAVRRRLLGPLHATAELQASVPLSTGAPMNAATAPIEALGSLQLLLPAGFAITGGGGGGLTRGLGSPSWRAFLSLDAHPRDAEDSDGDGIGDARDRCPATPEDDDHFQDLDGCPEPDNDQDGFLDRQDRCPDDAEVYNQVRDDDGCPDAAAQLQLRIRGGGPEPLEQAQVRLGEDEPATVIAEEPWTRSLPPGTVRLEVQAEGYLPHRALLSLGEGPQPVEVVLLPPPTGWLRLRVEDPDGQPLAATAQLQHQPEPDDERWLQVGEAATSATPPEPLEVDLPAQGLELRLPAGHHQLQVQSPGYRPATAQLDLADQAQLDQVVRLQPARVQLRDGRIEVQGEVHFATASAELTDADRALLAQLAELLLANPELELLRIEGHADERGSPRFNLELSRARAQAVEAFLLEQGVEAQRLEAIGTGEAAAASGVLALDRRVGFLVLIWQE